MFINDSHLPQCELQFDTFQNIHIGILYILKMSDFLNMPSLWSWTHLII